MTPRRVVALAAEFATIVLSIVVALSLGRVFEGNAMLDELIALALASHAVAIIARRAGFSMLPSALVSLIGFLVMANMLLFPETSGSVVPTRETLTVLRFDLSDAWTLFQAEQAPVEAVRGFVVVGGAALWLVAFLADWAAFRLRSTLEAVVPATTIFVFTAVLGAETDQVRHGALYAAAIAGVLLTMRADRQVREEVWVASGAGKGVSTTLRVGTVAATLAVVLGVTAGPAFPGAGDVLLDPSDWDNGPETRQVVSPLVEIGASLVSQSNFEMFSVRVENPQANRHYWRLMALTDFDGAIWKRKSNFEDARGPVGSDLPPATDRTVVRQTITTRSLGNIYMPAAYEVSSVVDSGGIGLEYETTTGALVVTRESSDAARSGFTYVIESAVPDYTPGSLPADATAGLDPEFVLEHTALPPACGEGDDVTQCWPSWVTTQAEEITAAATTDYERLQLLQSFFVESSTFTYDLNVANGHSIRTIEDFLEVRRGYCEQFSSTFAAMARSLGVPARVAVGFTWGDFDPARGEFVVRGEHAHAWPEVYFAGVGWIVLDPTPGRGPSHNSDITGLAPAQLDFNDEANRPEGSPFVPPTSLPDASEFNPGDFDPEFDLAPSTTIPVASNSGTGDSELGVFLLRAILVLFAVGLVLGIVPLLGYLGHRRRAAMVAADPILRGELAWDDACAALSLVGVRPAPQQTPLEFARRVERSRFALGPVWDLAEAVTELRYADTVDKIAPALDAQKAARKIERTCREQAGRRQVAIEALNPRNLRWN